MKHLGIPVRALSAGAVSLSLLLAACSSSDKAGAQSAAAPADASEGAPASVNIRYIDADSIMANYTLAKEFQELTLSQLNKLDATGQARQAELQKLAANIEHKMRTNGYLSQESYEADMANVNQKQQDAANVLARMERQAQADAAQRQNELNDSLESFIRDYNATKGYDAILFKAAGVYFNPALDITQEVIAGLNARYAKSKK